MDEPDKPQLPEYWGEYILSPDEIAEMISVPVTTLNQWARLARAMDFASFGERDKGRRLYRPLDAYALGLMAELYRLQVPITPETLKACIYYTYDDGDPYHPVRDQVMVHGRQGGLGQVTVQAWLVFAGVQHFVSELIDFSVDGRYGSEVEIETVEAVA
ncbi:hypothetical protein ASG43_07855 [Aureimonas sp. Leaf454]|uniref:hypothetical protein n=1 Tax=Aureimonas sp. Leaf454 TaxID=1736381 RepID=UPI0006F9595E|nr:hypothetical protein [Aureimonas sp. Leaf454]KQT48760.1 hypothetical protein ASG43_07855 [Aureimonas sp. Leaf454]